MHKPLLALLLLLPLPALAQTPQCKHSQPRNLQLDLAGVKTVVFDIANHDIEVVSSPGGAGAVSGQACASEEKLLAQLVLSQQRTGDKLVVLARREGMSSGLFFNSNYSYLKLAATLPDQLTVQLKVGSGDASVTGASIASADVGSGDAKIRRTRGLVAAKVGSGDIDIDDAGSLNVISVGSGDVKASNIRGSARLGEVGSGDFELDGAKGDVEIGAISSGDAKVSDVTGNVHVGSVGSGDVEARAIGGNLTVDSVGSGSVSHGGIKGKVSVPPED